MLSEAELARYDRQMLMPGWGRAVQEKLKARTVFVAGAGGLGSPASLYLAAAGVGHLRVCDFDEVQLSNLNRQILHDDTRLGVNKALSAQTTLRRINPHVRVTALQGRITTRSVDRLVGGADIILDCMDNYPTRFVLNAAAIRKRIPLVHASIRGLEGRLAFLRPPRTACLRCMIRKAPAPEVFPVVGAAPGVIGSLQAVEAVKFLAGIGENLTGRLLIWDGVRMERQVFSVPKDPSCPACRGRR